MGAVPYEKSTPIIECTRRPLVAPTKQITYHNAKSPTLKRAVTDRSLICTAFKNNRKNSFNDKFNIKKNIPTFYVLHIHIHPIVKDRSLRPYACQKHVKPGVTSNSAFDMNYTVQPPYKRRTRSYYAHIAFNNI